MRLTLTALLLGAALTAGTATAQEIEWQQTLNLPKGMNLPAGIALDILGLAPGDSYDEAKAKLLAIAPPDALEVPNLTFEQRMSGNISEPPFQELSTTMYVDLGSRSRIDITYPSRMLLDRQRATQGRISERIQVDMSAPSSGSQVILVERSIAYRDEPDQPRISEVVRGLTEKIGLPPTEIPSGSSRYFRWQFDGGKQVAGGDLYTCQGGVAADLNASQIEAVNRDGTCDVLLMLEARIGISDDHAERLRFYVSDNERGKQNIASDYDFFDAYVAKVQSGGGAAPTL